MHDINERGKETVERANLSQAQSSRNGYQHRQDNGRHYPASADQQMTPQIAGDLLCKDDQHLGGRRKDGTVY